MQKKNFFRVVVSTGVALSLLAISTASAKAATADSYQASGIPNTVSDVKYDVGTFEETSKLPVASSSQPLSTFRSASLFTTMSSRPSSIADYQKLGYSSFQYSQWTGDKIVMSTKSKRIATFMVEQLTGLIPGGQVKVALGLFDLSQLLKTQHEDIWPTTNLRNITAIAPVGYRTLIGQEVILKYYSNSARTNLIKTIHTTLWVG